MAKNIKCWNCLKEIPASAIACKYCDAQVEDEPSEEEKAAVHDIIGKMDPEAQQALMDAFNSSESADEFVNSIMVGQCIKCDSSNTEDCESDPEIDNPLVCRCLDCGCHWCILCESVLDRAKLNCPCWEEDLPEIADM